MAFIVGNDVIVNREFVLGDYSRDSTNENFVLLRRGAQELLGSLFGIVMTIASIGNATISTKSGNTFNAYAVQLVPLAVTSPFYNDGDGVMLYVESDVFFNQLFYPASVAFLDRNDINLDLIQGFNNSGQPIAAGTVVRITADSVDGGATVVAADSGLAANAGAIGVVGIGGIGALTSGTIIQNGVIAGHAGYPLDTSAVPANQIAYLGAAGAIAPAAGAVPVIVGTCVVSDAVNGVLNVTLT